MLEKFAEFALICVLLPFAILIGFFVWVVWPLVPMIRVLLSIAFWFMLVMGCIELWGVVTHRKKLRAIEYTKLLRAVGLVSDEKVSIYIDEFGNIRHLSGIQESAKVSTLALQEGKKKEGYNDTIVELAKGGSSERHIVEALGDAGVDVSRRQVSNILREAGMK